MLRLACLSGLLLLSALPASAQDFRRAPPDGGFYGPGVRVFPPNTPFRGAGDRLCVAWCPSDTSPCDPPVYKQADGRCMRDEN